MVDHGRIYLSEHLRAVCARFGISIQPARPYHGTDKGALERFFRTLREDLLAALPGYKGPDVYSRGEHVEEEAYYFIDELEQVLRDWGAERYHHRPHDGRVEPAVPGLDLSPAEMFEAGVARAGRLRVPARADLAHDFLPVEWRTIQHYGVELRGLRYPRQTTHDHHRHRLAPHRVPRQAKDTGGDRPPARHRANQHREGGPNARHPAEVSWRWQPRQQNLAAPDDTLPFPLAVAIVGQYGPERVCRYHLLARSPSIRQAALAMGWNPPTLSTQLKVLEHTCGGGALINRHRPTHEHQKLTPLGQRLLDQADDHFGRPMLAKERSA